MILLARDQARRAGVHQRELGVEALGSVSEVGRAPAVADHSLGLVEPRLGEDLTLALGGPPHDQGQHPSPTGEPRSSSRPASSAARGAGGSL